MGIPKVGRFSLQQMGKELQHQESGITIKSSNPGCMWGILHVLHHHRWHHARKKMLPLKRHGGGKHGMGKQYFVFSSPILSMVIKCIQQNLLSKKIMALCPCALSSCTILKKSRMHEQLYGWESIGIGTGFQG